MNKWLHLFLLLFLFHLTAGVQSKTAWPHGKRCAVVLTYDDGLTVHLENAIPVLDSLHLKGTFYLADYLGMLQSQIPNWRTAAANGHELGNHTIYHPCEGGRPGREFVRPEVDLNNYTVRQMTSEIRTMNTVLTAIDGKTKRTFAYPCGDMKIKDTNYLELIKDSFIAARGVTPIILPLKEVNLYNVPCYAINGQSGAELIELVKQAEAKGGLLVFLFHGVGGGHTLNVSIQAHSELLHYLKQQEENIWIAPMVDVAEYISEQQQKERIKSK